MMMVMMILLVLGVLLMDVFLFKFQMLIKAVASRQHLQMFLGKGIRTVIIWMLIGVVKMMIMIFLLCIRVLLLVVARV